MAVPINSTRGPATTTRRQLVAAAGGVAAIAALATPAAASEPLVKLWEEYQRLTAECDAADDACMDAYRQRPEPPERICKRINPVGGKPYLLPLHPEDLESEFEAAAKWHGKALAEKRYAPRLQAMKDWQSACDASDERNGLAALEDKVHGLFERSNAVLEEILNTPPRTARGIVVWLQLLERYMPDAPSEPESEWTIDQRAMRRLLPAVRALC